MKIRNRDLFGEWGTLGKWGGYKLKVIGRIEIEGNGEKKQQQKKTVGTLQAQAR